MMGPLMFVNWSSVSSMFRGLMWIVAIVLAGLIVIHLMPMASEVRHSTRMLR